jgi:hypothetical protein
MSLVLVGSTSGSVTLQEPAVAGTTVLDLPATSGTILTTGSTTGINASAISSGVVAQANGGTGTTAGVTGFKNRIINGAMAISQRNGTSTITPANGDYGVDRWTFGLAQSSKLTSAQTTTAPAGFNFSTLITSSSSYTPLTNDLFRFTQLIEGFNFADLGFGTANAKTFTLSFWVRSSLTGTIGGSLQNNDNDRSYPFTYTINAANTFEYKTVTVAGDTTGTWVGATNGIGLYVNFSMGAGSGRLGTAGSWQAAGYYGATGQTNLVATSGATWYITGVQLEVGSTATSFDYRPYGTEMILCQRYYIDASYPNTGATLAFSSNVTNGNPYFVSFTYPVRMRASPTLTWSSWADALFPAGSATFQQTGVVGSNVYKVANATGVSGYFTGGYTASAEL